MTTAGFANALHGNEELHLRGKVGQGHALLCPPTLTSAIPATHPSLNSRFTLLNFTEMASVESTTADVANLNNRWPARLLMLDLYNDWFGSHHASRAKTLTIGLTAQFNIVMMYIYAENLRQFEVKLGEYFCIWLVCQELSFLFIFSKIVLHWHTRFLRGDSRRNRSHRNRERVI